MKKSFSLKIACLIVAAITLLSAIPAAATSPSHSGGVKAPAAVSAGHIDVSIGDFGTVGSAPSLSSHNTSAVTVEANSNARVGKDNIMPHNQVLIPSPNMHIIINDLVGEAWQNGFVYSADFKFGSDYLNLSTPETDLSTCVSLLTRTSGWVHMFRLGHDGAIYNGLNSNKKIDGAKVYPNEWFNFKVELIPYTSTSFIYNVYLNDVLICWSTYKVSPAKTAYSFRILASDKDVGSEAMLDNLRFRTYPLTEATNQIDMTLDLENLTDIKDVSGVFVKQETINGRLDTQYTTFLAAPDHGSSFNTAVTKDLKNSSNTVITNASSKSYFTITDKNGRLKNNDFVVSADMYFKELPDGKLPLIQWLRGKTATSSVNTFSFFKLDPYGELYFEDVSLGKTIETEKWFNLTARVQVIRGYLYEIALYLDGELVGLFEKVMKSDNTVADNSFIKMWSNDAKFKSYIDNIQLYEIDAVKTYDRSEVIWDVDFDTFDNGAIMNEGAWYSVSSGFSAIRSNLDSRGVIENGRLKISNNASGSMTDLKVGGGTYDPLKTGAVEVSMIINVKSFYDNTSTSSRIIRWRRIKGESEISSAESANILEIKGQNFVFCGVTLPTAIELNKDYDIKVILNGTNYTASLYMGGEKVIDAAPIPQNLTGENLSYIIDDAGIKYNLPYTGFVYKQAYDANGAAIENTYVRRFVEAAGYGVDTLRLFQASDDNGKDICYYVDDFKVKRVDSEVLESLDFTGWSNYSNTTDANHAAYYNCYFTSDEPVIAKEENGNEYLSCNAVQRLFVGDWEGEYLFQSFDLSFDMLYQNGTGESAKSSILNKINFFVEKSNYYTNNSDNQYINLLSVDGLGNLYNDKQALIASGLEGKWTNIRIRFIGNGEKWTSAIYYINGAEVYTTEKIADAKTIYSMFRFLPNKKFTMGIDNFSMTPYVEEKTAEAIIDLDFSQENAADKVAELGSDFRFPALGTSEADSTGTTRIQSQISDGFLKIDYTKLTTQKDGFIFAKNDKYVAESEYLIETDIRYSCDVGYALSVVNIMNENYVSGFSPVTVKGAYNTLYADIRGASYQLFTSSGKELKVKAPTDSGSTKIAILVNEENETYTVYVDDKIAYYYYDGEYLPAASLPMTFGEDKYVKSGDNRMKLLEIETSTYNDFKLDVGSLKVTRLPSNIGSSLVATQTRINDLAETFDIRFIAGIDSLYGSEAGFSITATYVEKGETKTVTKNFASNQVFSSILNGNQEITAESLGSTYLFVMSIEALPTSVSEVKFDISTFIDHAGVRIDGSNQKITAVYSNGKVTTK